MLILSCIWGYGKVNLVPNYSFEDTLRCDIPQIYNSPPWFNPTGESPDYYNPFEINPSARVPYNWFGYQPARTGHAYAGLGAGGNTSPPGQREYIEAPLDSPLIAGRKYCVRFYVNLGDSSGYATDGMGAYLSVDTVQDYTTSFNLPYVPQITNPAGNILTDHVNWVLISGEYTALGGEKFITIGNFKDDASSNTQQVSTSAPWLFWCYYYIEDVYIGSCDTTTLTSNSAIIIPSLISGNQAFEIKGATEPLELYLYNSIGQVVCKDMDYKNTLNAIELRIGIYYYIKLNNGEVHKGKLCILK
jgi:OOP family OmpA-OmpF porin